MSAKSSVTVPVGSSLTPTSPQLTAGMSAQRSVPLMLASVQPYRMTEHRRKRAYTPAGPRRYDPSPHASSRSGRPSSGGAPPDRGFRPSRRAEAGIGLGYDQKTLIKPRLNTPRAAAQP